MPQKIGAWIILEWGGVTVDMWKSMKCIISQWGLGHLVRGVL